MVTKRLLKSNTPPLPHHSAVDWDFLNANWSISTATYISPPSSLRFGPASEEGDNLIVCKNPAVLKMTTGRLVTYLRAYTHVHNVCLNFRNTAPPGIANEDNCYQISFTFYATRWYIYERVNAANVRSWSQPKSQQNVHTWYRWRISWWYAWNVLNVTLDLEKDGEWEQQGDIISIPDDRFAAEPYQRTAIRAPYYIRSELSFIDDTEIWEYIP